MGARGLEALPGDNFGVDRTDALPLGPGEAREPPGRGAICGRGRPAQRPSAPAGAAESGVRAQKRALPCPVGRRWRAQQSGWGGFRGFLAQAEALRRAGRAGNAGPRRAAAGPRGATRAGRSRRAATGVG